MFNLIPLINRPLRSISISVIHGNYRVAITRLAIPWISIKQRHVLIINVKYRMLILLISAMNWEEIFIKSEKWKEILKIFENDKKGQNQCQCREGIRSWSIFGILPHLRQTISIMYTLWYIRKYNPYVL